MEKKFEKEIEIQMSKKMSTVNKYSVDLHEEIIGRKNLEVRTILINYLLSFSEESKKYSDAMKKMIEDYNLECLGTVIEKYECTNELVRYIYSTLANSATTEENKKNYEILFRKYCSYINEPKKIKEIPLDGSEVSKKR